jgi:hypothetical protein
MVSMSPLIFGAVLAATLVTDACWALYMLYVTKKSPVLATSYGVIIHILTAFTVISYTSNFLYLIPLVIGSFIGTCLVVRHSK